MTIFDSLSFGDFLQDYRKKHHLTQQVLAARLNVTMRTVKKWEEGTSVPSVKSMVRIADEMKVPLAEIYRFVQATR